MNYTQNKLEFRRFERKDFQEYSRWFEDDSLKNALGHIDEEWLHFILNDKEGTEIVALKDKQMIGVIGLSFPNQIESSYTITNIAVKPNLKNNGIGSEILAQLLNEYQLKKNEYWVSYVEIDNINGQRFFEKNGWIKINEKDMIRYIFQ